ncbi:unnamed protein product, partial [Meganyctiphanes norvegica]
MKFSVKLDADKKFEISMKKRFREKKTVVEGSGKLDFGEYELQLCNIRYNMFQNGVRVIPPGAKGGRYSLWEWLRPTCIPITIILTLSILIVAMALLDDTINHGKHIPPQCQNTCRYQLVESMPQNLTYDQESVMYGSIYDAWVKLISEAEQSIDIAAFYWTLRNKDITPTPEPSSWQGEDVFQRLYDAGTAKERNLKIRIAQNAPSRISPQTDSAIFAKAGAAEVRSLDFDKLIGGGVLHTKMWIIDGKHIYLGSANMDWRSLTQVKEVGVLISNCSCLAQDMNKIFEVYWQLGKEGAVIPKSWPYNLHTEFNSKNQMKVELNNKMVNTYLSSSPPPFCPEGRNNDVDAIVDVIRKAQKFVYIAVMDYFPRLLYTKQKKFWPVIDDALRSAAYERGVRVRILGSHWNHTRADMKIFLKSLQDLSGSETKMDIETRLFVVPAYTEEQQRIPFGRVNHNKYMVTDNTAYIGTSNWSGDYFINTGGIGLIVNETLQDISKSMNPNVSHILPYEETSLRQQLQTLFVRDWTSEHAKPIDNFF